MTALHSVVASAPSTRDARRPRRGLALASLVVGALALGRVFLAPTVAEAQASPAVALAEIREQILYANYGAAITAAQAFLERTDLDARSRAIGLEVLATAHIANRDQSAADETLRELYRRDPGHRLTDGDASPLVQAAFQRARERLPDTIPVRLNHQAPRLTNRESPEVRVAVADGLEAVQEVRIAYRTGGAPRFANLVLNLDGSTAVGRLPLVGSPDQAQRIEYFVLALAPSGTPLAQLGDEAEPLVLDVPAERREANPLTPPPPAEEEGSSKWWVGVLVGVVVAAAAGVTVAFLLREEAPSGSLGGVSLEF
ncbi:MAG: hypothetical protein H6722_28825 [Sandaracinus sp.]|nr:hypothetical protein [Sandaracinus sp.]MCB9625354.1 hypothetical protein [Sandaracinus sp.]